MADRRDVLSSVSRDQSPAPHRATVRDTAEIFGAILLPTLAIGVIKRRPWAMALAARTGVDRLAVARMRALRDRHGGAPVVLPLAGEVVALPLAGYDVNRLLDQTPALFTAASSEKRAALGHFQPHGLLVSDEPERAPRREFTEAVLQSDREAHELSARIVTVAHEEAAELLARTASAAAGELTWESFNRAWWQLVRRVVLGDSARGDAELTGLLDRLRLDANWAFLHPRRRRVLSRFRLAVEKYLRRAEPGSLAQLVQRSVGSRAEIVDPASQVAHWLFAFDAAGMTAFRTLAVLATHPEQLAEVREEQAADGAPPGHYLRACILDTVRLWPTTPMLLRQSREKTEWGTGSLPPGSHFLIFTPFFHRDPRTVPAADRFAPEHWLDETARDAATPAPAVVPFSAGPARCPGRNLVLQLTGALLAAMLTGHTYQVRRPKNLRPDTPLPATLDNFRVRLGVRPGNPEAAT